MSLLLAAVPWWGRILAVGAVLVAAAAFGAAKMHAHDQARYDALEGRFEAFKDQTAALGSEAKAAAKVREAADKQKKESSDAENAAALATLARTIGELRRNSGGRVLPSAPACPGGSPGADRYESERQRAYRELVAGLRAEADRGSKATVDLNSAKRWALKLATDLKTP